MKRICSKNRVSRFPAVAVCAAALLWGAPWAGAARADCLLTYVRCVEDASDRESFLGRSFAGLRCFNEFLACLQRRLA